jgi:hypothetical protein
MSIPFWLRAWPRARFGQAKAIVRRGGPVHFQWRVRGCYKRRLRSLVRANAVGRRLRCMGLFSIFLQAHA